MNTIWKGITNASMWLSLYLFTLKLNLLWWQLVIMMIVVSVVTLIIGGLPNGGNK
jgi:hypothetical protein